MAQAPPIAAKAEQWALVPSGEVEARIMFKAMTNVVLSGVRKWASPAVARPLELEVGHARELAEKAQTIACPRMRHHGRLQTAHAGPYHQTASSQRPKRRQ